MGVAEIVVRQLGDIPGAQFGYFTRAQASAVGVEDFSLTRSVDRGYIQRLGHGVYRVVGAGDDPLQDLRVAWLRLEPARSPRERTLHPDTWVSHESVTCGPVRAVRLRCESRVWLQVSASVRQRVERPFRRGRHIRKLWGKRTSATICL